MADREFKAQGPWVMVEPIPPPVKTDGGIYRPEGNLEDRLGYSEGIVCSSGPGKHRDTKNGRIFEHPGVQPGDKVLFRGHLKGANKPLPMENNRCLLHQDDLLGILVD